MDLSTEQRRIIIGVLAEIESSNDYSNISIYNDGPGKIKQLTYGRLQTTEYGNLPELLKRYVAAGGKYATAIQPFIPKLANPGQSLVVGVKSFKDALRLAAKDDPVMRAVQDKFFEDVYLAPALNWCKVNGFERALSALVVFDSYIHSGGIKAKIRNRFREVPPIKGGDEAAWILAYTKARQEWLVEIGLKATTYRTKCYLEQIQQGNWDLSKLPIRINGASVR